MKHLYSPTCTKNIPDKNGQERTFRVDQGNQVRLTPVPWPTDRPVDCHDTRGHGLVHCNNWHNQNHMSNRGKNDFATAQGNKGAVEGQSATAPKNKGARARVVVLSCCRFFALTIPHFFQAGRANTAAKAKTQQATATARSAATAVAATVTLAPGLLKYRGARRGSASRRGSARTPATGRLQGAWPRSSRSFLAASAVG